MSNRIPLSQIHASILDAYANGHFQEADKFCGLILAQIPGDFLANKMMGLIARDHRRYSPGLTYLRNAARKNPDDPDVVAGIADCIAGMNVPQPGKDIFVIGDSHTEPFRRFDRTAVCWVGPVSMHRVAKEGLDFLDYRFYGVTPGSTVICVFGEIDARAHILKSRDKLREEVDRIVSGYLKTMRAAGAEAKIARQIVSSMMPPTTNPPHGFPVEGSIDDRIQAVQIINDRLAFGCKILGFHYLDQYTLFRDETGALDQRFSDDGLHISSRHAQMMVGALEEMLAHPA